MKRGHKEIDRYSEVVEDGVRAYARIHLGRNDGLDMTLCGVALEGERGDNQMLRTRRRVTCTQCIGTIRYCKTIPNSVLRVAVT